MEKRVQVLPLLMMVFCGGVSLSSGLYYYDIPEYVYVIPLGFLAVSYYVIRQVFRKEERREKIALGAVAAMIFVIGMLLWVALKPGFCDLMQTISIRMERGYGVGLGTWDGGKMQYVGLVICYLVSIVTAISLFLYETNRPLVVVALPSFLLFSISITADGVPYGKCLVAYAMAMLTFLGMGKGRGGLKRLILLMGCGLLTAVLSFQLISWPEMDSFLRGYRDNLMVGQENQRATPKRENLKYRDDQTIDFGQFSEDGDIYYSGTVQMELTCDGEFKDEELFLRGFIGQVYSNASWYGEEKGGYYVREAGNVFKKNRQIRLTPKYDAGVYYPYSVSKNKYSKLLQRSVHFTKREKSTFEDELHVDGGLRKHIRQQMYDKETFETIGELVTYVNQYLSANYEYTLHPGKKTEDELERFMFDTKRGYCTHFASTAVMVFRTAGVPARIAQGYMIDGVKIKPNETINVRDSDSHAWVEIYISKKGWVPVDVTPYTNRVTANEESSDYGDEEESMSEEPALEDVSEEAQPDEDEPDEEESDEEELNEDAEELETEIDEKEESVPIPSEEEVEGGILRKLWRQPIVRVVVHLLLGCFVFGIVQHWYRNRNVNRIRKKMKKSDRCTSLLYVNEQLQPFWATLQTPWNYLDSSEMTEEILQRVIRYYNVRKSQDAVDVENRIRRYVLCIYTCRFGKEELSEENYEECLEVLRDILDKIEKNADKKLWKKLSDIDMIKVLKNE